MSSHVLRAAADRLVVLDLAVGTSTTGSHARVDTLQLEAGLVASTVVVGCALSEAPVVGVSLEELRTGALDVVVGNGAMGAFTAGVVGAGVDTAVLAALAVAGAVTMHGALSMAGD